MLFIKVSNIKTIFGSVDYKGLDLNKIVAGSQVYVDDFSSAYLATTEGSLPENVNIEIIEESEYLSVREAQHSEIQSEKDRLKQLEQDSLTALIAISELYELLTAKEV